MPEPVANEPLLALRGLTVSYGHARVLEGVDLSVSVGEVVGLVGPNGAGKTTTLRAISGIVRRKSGSITVDGQELRKRPDFVAAHGVIHVPEGRGLMPTLTVTQNLRLGALAVGHDLDATARQSVIEVFPALEAHMDKRAGLLSGGEQQMVAVARGLVMHPRVLMVDELSLGLAPKIVTDLLRTLAVIAKERQVGLLLVDQNVRALAETCDRLYYLEDGAAHLSDPDDEEVLQSVYFGH